MKNQILDILKTKGPRSFKQIRKGLGLYGYNDSKLLNNTLRSLVADKLIYFKKSTETYQMKDKIEVIGIFYETKQDYGFVETDKGVSYFIPGKFTLNALHGDSVRIVVLPSNIEGKDDIGKIVRVMKRNGNNIVGTVELDDQEQKIVNVMDNASKHPYVISNPNNVNVGDVVVTKFVDYQNFEIKVKVIENLGPQKSRNDWQIVAKRNNWDLSFDQEVLEEANRLKEQELPSRTDLTDRLIVTIDGETSKDLDDAIDVKKLDNGNWRLGVHIADVSHYVQEDSVIDREAERRGTSVYLIDKVLPMLPEVLSNDLCSLNPNTKKLAMTVDMEVNSKGKVVKVDIYESIIESKYRLTYTEVEELLTGKVEDLYGDVELTEMLKEAYELSKVSRAVKVKKGMIDFALPEIKVDLDEEGEPLDLLVKFQTISEKLIEDLMVLTNESVAKFLDDNEIPSLFRIHLRPQEENIEKFKDNLKFFGYLIDKPADKITNKDLMSVVSELDDEDHNSLIIKRMLIQTMEKAIYSSSDEGHYGLGLENYLHFTSPIRRYPDLIVHRTLKDYVIHKTKTDPTSEERWDELNQLAKLTSERERTAMSTERQLTDIKKTRLMKDQVGSTQEGTIVTITNFGIFIELENFTQGLTRFDKMEMDEVINTNGQKVKLIKGDKVKKYRLGQKVNVKIVDLDISRGLMDFEIQDESNS